MAYAARLLSRSNRQVINGQIIFRPEYVVPARSFAKAAGDAKPASQGDEILKGIFGDITKKFVTATEILRNEKITIDSKDPAAVSNYARIMKTLREKAGLLSESEKIKDTIVSRTHDIPDVRSYMLALKDIRVKSGLVDELGMEAMMINALDKVEKELKRPLLREDEKGVERLRAEFNKINQKFGIRTEDLPKYEEELDLKMAKAELELLEKDAIEAMETEKKRDDNKDQELPEIRSLDVRSFL